MSIPTPRPSQNPKTVSDREDTRRNVDLTEIDEYEYQNDSGKNVAFAH
jgi:hypothetical protein